MDQESSDEDDVFSCGRCKEQFSTIEDFVEHKKSRTCRKVKQQQQSQTLPSQNFSSLPEEMLDNSSATSQEAYHSRSFTEANIQEATSPDLEYSIQPSVARLLAVLQGGQLAGQTDILTPGPSSDVYNGQAIVRVFEKILESQSRDMPKDLDYDGCLENSAEQNPEDFVRNSQMTENFTSQGVPVYPSENQTFAGSNSESLILETRADVDVHKIKTDSAVEFLKQSAVKRKRGRPQKGHSGKKQTTIPCPHCNLSFKTKSLCLAHVKKHHCDSTEMTSSKMELPSQRRRKCSRCSFQTTASKDLTAHIHNYHGNKQNMGGESSETAVEKSRDSLKRAQEDNTQTRRGRKRKRIFKGELVDIISSPNNDDHRGKTEIKPRKSQVKCPECKKKLDARGLKRHQVRCTNRNRFVCPLCQHKSRESYDHGVHVDNHRTWVKAQSSWVGTSKQSGSKPDEESASATTVDDKIPMLVATDSNSMMSQEDKVDYTSTADLEELAFITQIQNEADLIRQNHELSLESSGKLEADALPAVDSSQLEALDEEKCNSIKPDDMSTEQDSKATDGGDKKLNPRDLKCKICYTWFARTSLPKHMLQAHNMVKRFQCRELTCKEIFAKVEDFKVHVACHSTENTFVCGCRTCMNRRLITPEKMEDIRKEKMRDYYKHMTHKCSKCWVKFPSQGSLERHLKRETHIHPCNVCGKIQVSNRQLRMHMVIHQNERAYLCDVCGQPFKTKRDLNKHTFSHTNIRPYGCSECSKCFSFKNKLARHILTVHSGTRPFACEWLGCDKAFSRKDKLSEHAKTHVVTDPFKCQYCDKGFCRKDILKDHEISHTREFRFSCNVCNKGFMRPKMLEQHCQDEHASIITIHGTPDENSDLPNQPIGYILCEPYTYANIDHLTAFQENVPETDQLMQGQRATIEALQNAAAAVIGNGQNHFQIDTTDTFPVISLST